MSTPANSPANSPASQSTTQPDSMVDRYAVIGNPVGHSKSPAIHAAFAAACGQNLSYQALLAPLDGFAAFTREFFASGALGANITVPFKLEALALADELSARARAAGAVNTLCWRDGKILGDNTDGVGLVRDIVENAGQALAGRRLLLLGAGGAARGVLLPLLEQKPAQVVLANRTLTNAQQLVTQMQAQMSAQTVEQLPGSASSILQAREFAALDGQFDLIINATSASLQGSLPPLAASLAGPDCLAYDMMYGAEPTIFMQWASSHGARVRDGLGMLVEQAAEAFYLWRGVRPVTSAVFANLRAQLS